MQRQTFPGSTNPHGSIARRLFDALGQDTANDLLALFRRETTLVLSELNMQLNDEGRAYLESGKCYCSRWDEEGGPHPGTSRRQRTAREYDPFEEMDRAFERGHDPLDERTWHLANVDRGTPALPEWNDEHTQVWRGKLRGALYPLVSPQPPSSREDDDALSFGGTSEAAVTAILRAVDAIRTEWPGQLPKREQIKARAATRGGAGDRALQWALDHKLLTPDFQLTKAGKEFLGERT